MNFKIGLLAAVMALAAPVASYATTIRGDVQIDGGLTVGGTTSLTDGNTAVGIIDFNTSLITTVFDATGDLGANICTQQDAIGTGCTVDQVSLASDQGGIVDFAALPENFWRVAGFFFNITEIVSVSVPDASSFSVTGRGVIGGNGFDETKGDFSISSDTTDSTTRIAFSSTTTAVPVPAAGLLLIGGMGGLALMRRRQKKAA